MFIKTIFKGSLGAVEQWSTSVTWGIFGLAGDSSNQPEADGLLAALRTASAVYAPPASLRQLLSTGGSIDGIRLERRAENETVLNVAEGLFATPTLGTGSASKTPQDAMVLSLRTSTPGPRGRGRMYWPALGASLNGSFQLTTPAPADIATATKTWLNAINTAMNGYWVSVGAARSAVLSVRSVTDHVCRDVNSLQFGSVLDTQRRRRDALPESYNSIAWP